MRITLTLDDDVAARLERLRRDRDGSLESVVNEVMREGFAALEREARVPSSYTLRPRALGRPRVPLESVADALAIAEGEPHG